MPSTFCPEQGQNMMNDSQDCEDDDDMNEDRERYYWNWIGNKQSLRWNFLMRYQFVIIAIMMTQLYSLTKMTCFCRRVIAITSRIVCAH